MTLCNQQTAIGLTGFGASSKSYEKAFKRAHKDFMASGKKACMPGTCGTFGSRCTFRPTDVDLQYREINTVDGIEHQVQITGDGECRCE